MNPKVSNKTGQYKAQAQLESERCAFTISPPTIPRISDSESSQVFSGAPAWRVIGSQTITQGRPSSQETKSIYWPSNQSRRGVSPPYHQDTAKGRKQRCYPVNALGGDAIQQAPSQERYFFTPLRKSDLFQPNTTPSQNSYTPSMTRPGSAFSADTLDSIDESIESEEQSPSVSRSMGRLGLKPKRGTSTSSSKQKRRKSPLSKQSITDDGQTMKQEKTPPQQNLRGDPFRSAKVKTELCRYYKMGKECPFGDKCNYAHGQHELKFTKLMDLEHAGLIDIEIFRARPCCTWVMCGTCPHDSRCVGLHDPRTAYKGDIHQIPHAETLINSIGSGANVDKLYHSRLAATYSCCPLYGYIPTQKWKLHPSKIVEAWSDFCACICNIGRLNSSSARSLSEVHVLEIIMSMRTERLGQAYSYEPTHLFGGELCMVLQTKSYQLISSSIKEVSRHFECSPYIVSQNIDVEAYEIAFGPVGDPSVRSLSVWFNIPHAELTPCTMQQAKHHKRSRHRLRKSSNTSKCRILPVTEFQTDESKKFDLLTKIPPFYHYQPQDDSTFDFVTEILNNRLNLLQYGAAYVNTHEYHVEQRQRSKELLNKFVSFSRYWTTWSWPVRALEEVINDETLVTPVDEEYRFNMDDEYNFQTETFFGPDDKRFVDIIPPAESKFLPLLIWKSFLFNIQLICRTNTIHDLMDKTSSPHDIYYRNLNRLKVFRSLSMGNSLTANEELPHLKGGKKTMYKNGTCIESLLVEWGEIIEYHKEHSFSSRTQKLLEPMMKDDPIEDYGNLLENYAHRMTRMHI